MKPGLWGSAAKAEKRSGGVKIRRPVQRLLVRVEGRAAGQAVRPVDERVAFGVGGVDRDRQRLAFLARDRVGQRVERRRQVDAGNLDRERLRRGGAEGVV